MTTPTIAAVRGKIRNYRLPADEAEAHREKLLAQVVIAAMFDTLDRTAMLKALSEAWWSGNDEVMLDAALAAGRQAALGASATPTEG
jgi:hypothetical protein